MDQPCLLEDSGTIHLNKIFKYLMSSRPSAGVCTAPYGGRKKEIASMGKIFRWEKEREKATGWLCECATDGF